LGGQLKLSAPVRLGPEAGQALLGYDWPGNVRELENVLQRAAILCTDGTIAPRDLLLPQAADGFGVPPTPAAAGRADPGSVIAMPAPGEGGLGAGLDAALEQNERRLIADALRLSRGSKKLAAERLGISPRTLRHKLQRMREAGFDLPALDD